MFVLATQILTARDQIKQEKKKKKRQIRGRCVFSDRTCQFGLHRAFVDCAGATFTFKSTQILIECLKNLSVLIRFLSFVHQLQRRNEQSLHRTAQNITESWVYLLKKLSILKKKKKNVIKIQEGLVNCSQVYVTFNANIWKFVEENAVRRAVKLSCVHLQLLGRIQ